VTTPWRARFRARGHLRAALAGRCPSCRRGEAFAGLYQLRPRCASCGVVYERDPGTWLGAAVLAYGAAILAAVLFAALTVPGRGLYPGLEWGLVATATLTVALLYRPIKALWLWITWVMGFVHRPQEDPDAPEATIP
jgi:uncharacterized protein (DUF983 family)